MMNLLHPTIITPTLIVLLLVFGYIGVPLWMWSLYCAVVLAAWNAPLWLWVLFGTVAVVLNVPKMRQIIVTFPLMKGIKALNILPKISDTERAAIEAGTVWVDGEFFSGKPDFQRINSEPYPQVTTELQTFLDNQVEQVCRLVSDWEIYRRKDLPPEVWDYLKQERFLGMMIPKEYGGLGFSNFAYSAVMTKLASRFLYPCRHRWRNKLPWTRQAIAALRYPRTEKLLLTAPCTR